jgi:hypothetical protein
MFIIYFLKKGDLNFNREGGVGRIDDVSQRAVKPDFPTRSLYQVRADPTRSEPPGT